MAGAMAVLVPAKGCAMAIEPQVLGAVDALVAARSAPFDALETLTRVTLAPDGSTMFFEIRAGAFPAGSPFQTIEVRRARNALQPQGMIIVTLRPEVCVPPQALAARYGEIDALAPPLAGGPPGRPVDWVYRRAWGELSFGVITSNSGDCIARAIIDWHG